MCLAFDNYQLKNHELLEKKYMDEGMPLADPSTWNGNGFTPDPLKNAHDKANLTAKAPKEFPQYDAFSDYNKYVDTPIEY